MTDGVRALSWGDEGRGEVSGRDEGWVHHISEGKLKKEEKPHLPLRELGRKKECYRLKFLSSQRTQGRVWKEAPVPTIEQGGKVIEGTEEGGWVDLSKKVEYGVVAKEMGEILGLVEDFWQHWVLEGWKAWICMVMWFSLAELVDLNVSGWADPWLGVLGSMNSHGVHG